jgi:hypothetical protein
MVYLLLQRLPATRFRSLENRHRRTFTPEEDNPGRISPAGVWGGRALGNWGANVDAQP